MFLCNQCGIEEIHHDSHLLVRLKGKHDVASKPSQSIEQQLTIFKEKTESKFERLTEENSEALKTIREEMNLGLQAIREEVQYRLERIERLFTNDVESASRIK